MSRDQTVRYQRYLETVAAPQYSAGSFKSSSWTAAFDEMQVERKHNDQTAYRTFERDGQTERYWRIMDVRLTDQSLIVYVDIDFDMEDYDRMYEALHEVHRHVIDQTNIRADLKVKFV